MHESLSRLWQRLQGQGVGARLVRGASVFLVIQGLGVGVSFASQVLLARLMGAESFGIYTVSLSWVVVLSVASRLGLSTTALRFVSQYESTGRLALLRGFLRTSRLTVGAASLVTAALMAAVVLALRPDLRPELAATLWIGGLAIPLLALLQLTSATLRGLKQVMMSQIPETVIHPVLLIGLAAGLRWIAGMDLDARVAMALYTTALFSALTLSTVALRMRTPREMFHVEAQTDAPLWRRVALPLLLIDGLNVIQNRADVLTIGSLVDATDAGIYSAASRICHVIPFGLLAVTAWAAPMIAEYHAKDQRRELQRVVRVAGLAILLFTLPLVGGAVFFGRFLLGLFGPGFEAAYPSLAILAIGQVVNALTGPVGFLMTMTGHQQEAMRIQFVHSLGNVILNLLLVPWLGIEGAAISAALTQTSRNVWMSIAVWQRLGVRATFF